MKTSTVHEYGPGNGYLRTAIPKNASTEVKSLKKGSVLSWDAIDSNSFLVKVVA